MTVKSSAIALAAGSVAALAFGICGVFFAVLPGPTSAFVSWVLHVDVTGMMRPISASDLVAGIVLFSAYVAALTGLTAVLYNRLAAPRAS